MSQSDNEPEERDHMALRLRQVRKALKCRQVAFATILG